MINNGFEERSEDRRIRKTKKALRAALVRLLSKESIAEITIKELTDEADVHRGTFYHHYRDAFDLKEQVEDGMRMPPKEMAKVMETMMMGSQQQVEGKQPVTV